MFKLSFLNVLTVFSLISTIFNDTSIVFNDTSMILLSAFSEKYHWL